MGLKTQRDRDRETGREARERDAETGREKAEMRRRMWRCRETHRDGVPGEAGRDRGTETGTN